MSRSKRHFTRQRCRIAVALALLALLPGVALGAPTTALAASKNANLDGVWSVSQKGTKLDADFHITGEDTATGSFGGVLDLPPNSAKIGHYNIVAGQVTGNTFTITADYPGTVVGENGIEATYAGTVEGSMMSGSETDFQVWRHGHKVDASADGDQTFTAERQGFDLSGTITFGCSGGASCSSDSAPLYDATIDVEGPSSASTTTDTDGAWKVSVPEGHYVITPKAPGVTFTPASLDVDVTKSEDGQDFAGCGATSDDDTSAPSMRIPSHASSGAWSLKGVYCWNTYNVTYYPSSGRAMVTWISDAWLCGPITGSHFFNADLGRTFYDNAIVGGNDAPGRAFPDNNGAIVQVQHGRNLLMSFHFNPGGASGTVTTRASEFTTTITHKGVRYACQPVDANASVLPHKGRKGIGVKL
jgi:hypothetical protein